MVKLFAKKIGTSIRVPFSVQNFSIFTWRYVLSPILPLIHGFVYVCCPDSLCFLSAFDAVFGFAGFGH